MGCIIPKTIFVKHRLWLKGQWATKFSININGQNIVPRPHVRRAAYLLAIEFIDDEVKQLWSLFKSRTMRGVDVILWIDIDITIYCSLLKYIQICLMVKFTPSRCRTITFCKLYFVILECLCIVFAIVHMGKRKEFWCNEAFKRKQVFFACYSFNLFCTFIASHVSGLLNVTAISVEIGPTFSKAILANILNSFSVCDWKPTYIWKGYIILEIDFNLWAAV